MCHVGRAGFYLAHHHLDVASGDFGDRPLAPSRDELVAQLKLGIVAAALRGQLVADIVFADAGECARALALFGKPLPLDFRLWIDPALDQGKPFPRPGAGLLKRDLAIGTERAPRRVSAARIAGDERERLGAVLGDAHAEPGYERVHDVIALARRGWLEPLDGPIVENSFSHSASRGTDVFRGNVGATNMPALGCCPM